MRISFILRILNTSVLAILLISKSLGQVMPGGITSQTLFSYYDQLYRVDARLISGDFYQDLSPKSTNGHPYYGDKEWQNGSVIIDKTQFDSLLLRYDICKNELVCSTLGITNSNVQVSLKKEPITRFTMRERVFVPFPFTGEGKEIRFCEVLANGPVTLLLLHSKALKVPAGGNSSYTYEAFSKMSLSINGKIVNYQGKQTLYRLYPQVKPALRSYIRTEKLRLWGKKPKQHARLVEFCNSILTTSK
jgi:hypothetical protein